MRRVALWWAALGWILAAGWSWAQRPQVPRHVVEERLLTFSAYHSPAFSPSGELLAYVSVSVSPDGAKRQDLWVQNLRTGTRAQLSRNSDCSHPTWSPKGDLLAVAAIQSGAAGGGAGLWVMQADGGRQTQMLGTPAPDAPRSPVWSPVDDNLVAFLSPMERVAGSNPQRRMNIYTINIGTSDSVPHFVPAEVEVSPDSGLAWSADGKAIFFLGISAVQEAAEGQPAPAALWRLDLTSGKFEQAAPAPEDYTFKSLALAAGLESLSALLVPRGTGLRKKGTLALLGSAGESVRMIKSELPLPEGESEVPYGQAVTWAGDGRTCVVVTGRDLLLLGLATGSEVETKGCASNLRKLYAALVAYTQAQRGNLPEAGAAEGGQEKWVAAVTPYLSDVAVLGCPLEVEARAGSSYEFNPALSGKVLAYVEERATTPLLTERVPRHGGKRAVLMADGQVRLL